jgi:DNA-binding NarL/FixJ family response regulator
MALPVRIAVLSDDCRRSDAWTSAINADGAYIAMAFANGAGLRLTLTSTHPDFVVIDQELPGALSVCADISRADGPRVIVANVSDSDDGALDALSAGARGIVYTTAPADDLVKALRVVANNQVWAPRHVIVASWIRLRSEHEKRTAAELALAERLSSREREVFRYAAAGLGNKEVADRLSISEATVKVHLTHIFQKLGLRGRGELAAAYHGLRGDSASSEGRTTSR